jgi:hypothetical protein
VTDKLQAIPAEDFSNTMKKLETSAKWILFWINKPKRNLPSFFGSYYLSLGTFGPHCVVMHFNIVSTLQASVIISNFRNHINFHINIPL